MFENNYEVDDDNNLLCKALTYENNTKPFTIETIQIPVNLKENEVLVQIKTVSINPIDILLYRFSLPIFGSNKKVLGGDYSGIVVKSGTKSGYNVGESIYGYKFSIFKSQQGVFAQYAKIDVKKDMINYRIPKGMLFEQAAAIPSSALAGYGSIKSGIISKDLSLTGQNLKESLSGKKILILAAGTSVGSYAVEISKKFMNAKFIVATSSERCFQTLENLGADLVLDRNLNSKEIIEQILKVVKQKGKFDLILDCNSDELLLGDIDCFLQGSYVEIFKPFSIFNFRFWWLPFIPSWIFLRQNIKYLIGLSKNRILQYKLKFDPSFFPVIDSLWEQHKLETPIDSMFRGWIDYERAINKVCSVHASGEVVCIL